MKPIVLKLTAFGPYKDEEVIDFRELGTHRLFVISGQTGAGKTTIFDAISYALYAEASGSDRNRSTMLRSHFADERVHTAVDFTFEVRGATYRVVRQMEHVRPGNKGATGELHELYQIVNGQSVSLVNRNLKKEVSNKLVEIIGLKREQFNQIIMLPQGEFRKLLTSDANNKEEILRRIFQTGLYESVAKWLEEQRKEQSATAKLAQTDRDQTMKSIEQLLGKREDSTLQQVFAQASYNSEQVLDGLAEERQYWQSFMQQVEMLLRDEQAKNNQLREQLTLAQQVNQQFDVYELKQRELVTYEQQADVQRAREQEVTLAQRASQVVPLERQLQDVRQQVEMKWQQWQRAEQVASQAQDAKQRAQAQFDVEQAKEATRAQVKSALQRAEELRPAVRQLQVQQQQLAQVKRELDTAQQVEQATQQSLQNAQRLLDETKERQLKWQTEFTQLHHVGVEVVTTDNKWKTMQRAEQLWQQVRQLEQQSIQAVAGYMQAKAQFDEAERQWIDGQASVLAQHLQDGEACPVCGSVDHPHKANIGMHVVGRQLVDRLNKQVGEANEQVVALRSNLASKQEQLASITAEVVAAGFSLDQVSEAAVQLQAQLVTLRAAEQKFKQLQTDVQRGQEMIVQQEQQLAAFQQRKEVANTQLRQIELKQATEQAQYDTLLKQVPEQFQDGTRLEQHIVQLQQQSQQLEQAWQLVQQKLKQAEQDWVKVDADVHNALAAHQDMLQQLAQQEQTYEQAWQHAGFSSVEAYQAAKRTDEHIAQLQQLVNRYKEQIFALQSIVNEYANNLAGKQRVDVTTMQENVTTSDQQLKQISEQQLQTTLRLQQTDELHKQLVRTDEAYHVAEQKLSLLTEMSDVVKGKNNKKISLERYLQTAYLEDIIRYANVRLRKMSNGQFQLVRSERLESHGAQSGLNFDVYDGYTGQLRDVKTLSGGEKFNASLCLALGMSDVIQNFNGGVSLETMFIDEGFGSLDEESLQKAIDTLIDLQQTGRMVGVISHVEELKKAMPAILEVKRSVSGHSSTRFVVK